MSESRTSRSPGHDRHLLGLRRQPGRLAVAIFRLPLKAYRHNAGPALGRTFLAFTHVGRRTRLPHQAVAMVLRYVEASGEAVICAGWGPQTEWYRNLRAEPATQVQLGGRTFTPQQRFLTEEEAFDVAMQFRRAHPRRMRLISTVLGWGNLRDDGPLREFVRTHPFVAFRPTEPPAPQAPPGRERSAHVLSAGSSDPADPRSRPAPSRLRRLRSR
ncbi:nitroreductase family deazaflavin-dependent oxidoreductase [Pseudonocardia halophobica]|uniref:Deazaflavin-dependent oxidoreductase (Nitroreductase family) n=1 Tax=Pseudonocardia halophobica TaxID=29401 RepID=A0A9W6NUM8_9PSEU|nr:nitroreductase family deazaflavin-dependent oxidoreductase [Pseudonocardia halophobica]GLL09492.1 hypothetical protein GCM10017577_06320 [Pseudonocardia halophobica]